MRLCKLMMFIGATWFITALPLAADSNVQTEVLPSVQVADTASDKVFTVTLDGVVDALFMRSLTGDFATKRPAIEGSPYPYQGDGSIKAFQSSAFDDALNARVKFVYAGENLGGTLQLKAEQDSGGIGDMEAWLRLFKHIKISTGNMAQRGQVERYQNFDDFLKTKVDSFGILFPAWKFNPASITGDNLNATAEFPYGYAYAGQNKGFAEFAGTDTNDLFMPAGPADSTTRQPLGFLLDLTFAPVTVSASVGGLFQSQTVPTAIPWSHARETAGNNHDNIYDPLLRTGLNFGFRVEVAKILDMLTLAAVYKYADTYLGKTETAEVENLIEEKITNQAFGVYVNVITPVDGLGVSVGYSGLIRTWENPQGETTAPPSGNEEDAEEHYLSIGKKLISYPYYNGIDLRVSYTGINKLTLTSNNNVSFASVKGTDDRVGLKYAYGWAYPGKLNADEPGITEGRTEEYLGLYNALGAKYSITDTLTADLQAANQLGIFTLNWKEDDGRKYAVRSISNSLGTYAGVTITVIEKSGVRGSLRAGIDLKWNSYQYQDPTTIEKHKAGYLDFGIPIGLKVEF